ncbi:MAG: bifunctional fucokinase/L-fucose-1-P-guanylyltransferase [Prevotella sp.]|nr:bifunctional fucokinase/L-fucose-1-P-guanylyltransferase [Prevotella sp.]
MKKLLSLPPNLVGKGTTGPTVFHDITGLPSNDYFCTCDPEGHRVGSGGGTAWLLWQAFIGSEMLKVTSDKWADAERHATEASADLFCQWLSQEKRILLHAGGQSRRLPSYAPSGKILTPVPVFRWERGQRLNQDLLSLQLPLYERIMDIAPEGLNTMVVSGDVLIRQASEAKLPAVPQADVVCYGLWLDASVASHHGVFLSDRHSPQSLKCMLQKPSVECLQQLQRDHLFLTDIGIWLLSDHAVKLLMERCGFTADGFSEVKSYDLYSDFGRCLGTEPELADDELRSLSVAVVPLPEGEFYHFGTSAEMISSMVRLQNVVSDQRLIMHHDRKPHPSIFVQNALLDIKFTELNHNIWVENSCIGSHWTLSTDNVVTGVPHNDWTLALRPGDCLDIVPIGEEEYAVRPYHINDRFDGAEQQRPQFPVMKLSEIGEWLNSGRGTDGLRLLSAEQISSQANLHRLFAQRTEFRNATWPLLARNWQHSVFYQLDLDHAAQCFAEGNIPLPSPIDDDAPLMTRIHDAMFRGNREQAFGLLRQSIISQVAATPVVPEMAVCRDQIVWARCPVRIDIAGGWTDTPPYCLIEGGSVVNVAIELNGQPPIQAYVKPSSKYNITLRSIDMGAMEVVSTYEELLQYNKVGSPFSIPKAALALCGFAPQFTNQSYPTLEEQLRQFGSGIELTLLSAIPAGSGLGTSSVLAATVLGALSDFCSLAWDKSEICRRTLALEQLLTTGGGWQDQLGGLLPGVKLLESQPGILQQPQARWLPTDLYTQPEYRQCHLLYYTGITRTAKHILAEIVRRMFLNEHYQLLTLRQMKEHATDMYEALQRQDFALMGRLVGRTWQQNQLIDSGTNPPAVQAITTIIDDLCLGYKLPGAGGGGYLYMVAKDPEAAGLIKQRLREHSPNENARFVDMALSNSGLQVSRS